jgi:hypothetical protein
MFERNGLRRIHLFKREKITGSWRNIYYEKLFFLLLAKNNQNYQMKDTVMSRTCSIHGYENAQVHKILVGRLKGRSYFGDLGVSGG